MSTIITGIDCGSPAEKAGILAGERLLSINGKKIVDVLDYRFYGYDPDVTVVLENTEGEQRTLTIHKEEGQELGLSFQTYLMDKPRPCANHCIFCFVDQMPPGMRKTLYFKDDDARLSFLMGNYMTLTNLSEREIQRIIDLKISPINVSVHTTDPELRVSMLGHKRAGESIEVMRRLAGHGIEMNCQVVACPGINDGEALLKTLRDLAEMEVSSVAIVPVGVTKYREGLTEITPYTKEQAAAVIDLVEGFAKEHMAKKGTSFAWCSDEFYLVAGYPLPEKSYYEDMNQLENGVGMLRLLLAQASYALEDVEEANKVPFTVATGVLAAPFIEEILALAKKAFPEVEGKVVAIRNEFFGETITVSGLITGQDIVKQLSGKDLGERVLIPSNMLRAGEQVFLDDMTLQELEKAIGVPVEVVDAESGYDLADAMLGLPHETGSVSYTVEEDEYYRYNP